MILNPIKVKALVLSRSRTMNHPHGDLVLSGVSICASLNLDILGVKFLTASPPSNAMCVVLFLMFQRIGILMLVKCVLSTPLCYFVATMPLLSQSLSIVLRCGGPQLNVIFSFSSASVFGGRALPCSEFLVSSTSC